MVVIWKRRNSCSASSASAFFEVMRTSPPDRSVRTGMHFVLQALQHRHARRDAIVNQHRRMEISGGEHLRDVPEVHPNLVAAGGVSRVVRGDLDRAAVAVEAEVMRGLLVREAHHVIAALIDWVMVLLSESGAGRSAAARTVRFISVSSFLAVSPECSSSTARAPAGVERKRRSHSASSSRSDRASPRSRELPLDLFQLAGRHLPNFAARSAAAFPRAEDLRQFGQRKADRQRTPHNPDPRYRFGRILPVARVSAQRSGQHAHAFVVPQRVRADAAQARQFPGA